MINAGAIIGNNVIINTFANIEHDAIIGNQCHISTGSMINGECNVGERVFIGSLSVLSNGIDVGNDTIVGAGTIVIKSLPSNCIVAGVPAKIIKWLLWIIPNVFKEKLYLLKRPL